MRPVKDLNAALILALCCALTCLADDSQVGESGGAVQPLAGENHAIAMDKETVDIQVFLSDAARGYSYEVDCNFVFRNTSNRTVAVTMGFPESAGIDDPSEPNPSPTHFQDFRTWVDGKPIPVKLIPSGKDPFEFWWVKKLTFAPKQTRHVRNHYSASMSGAVVSAEEAHAPTGHVRASLSYRLDTGATWKGKIGSATVRLVLDNPFVPHKLSPPGYHAAGNLITWRWKNFEPTSAHNISAQFRVGPAEVYVDGRRRWQLSAQHIRYEPSLHGIPALAPATLLAALLGARADGYPETEDLTLSLATRSVRFVAGSDAVIVNGRNAIMPVTAQEFEDPTRDLSDLLVPISLTVQALGGDVVWDAHTGAIYIRTPKAIAVASAEPEWLHRRLTSADIKNKTPHQLRLMRNEIYARKGRPFDNAWLRHYFFCQPWYKPNPAYSDALLTATDWANIRLLLSAEKQKKQETR